MGNVQTEELDRQINKVPMSAWAIEPFEEKEGFEIFLGITEIRELWREMLSVHTKE